MIENSKLMLQWQRSGRGKSFEFYVLDEEVLHVLMSALPRDFEPYSIIGTANRVADGTYVQQATEVNIEYFSKLRDKGIWQFFVRSKLLTDSLNLDTCENLDGYLASCGLILLQQGLITKGKYNASRLALVNEVKHQQTGEVRRCFEYSKIYTALVRSFKSLLVHKVTTQFLDGAERVLTQPIMSTKFAAQVVSGKIQAWAVPSDTN